MLITECFTKVVCQLANLEYAHGNRVSVCGICTERLLRMLILNMRFIYLTAPAKHMFIMLISRISAFINNHLVILYLLSEFCFEAVIRKQVNLFVERF